jgi:outer membrane receptor for ferrienterochelin and colicin
VPPHHESRGGLLALAMAPTIAWAQLATPPASPGGELNAIVVKSDRLAVESLIDRKVYSVKDDLQNTFGSVGDILSVIPSVDVDSDGIVSLRGDTNVLILVDGRPSAQFSGPSAGDNLQSFPARDIERIEIITNPPAQYKAEGTAGVINIITRRTRPKGVAGSLQGSLGSGGRSVVGADASYSAGPLTTSLTSTYRQDYRQRSIQSDLLAPDTTTGQLVDNSSSINERLRRIVPPVSLTGQYALNDRQTVSLDASRGGRAGLRTYTEINGGSTAAGAVTSSTERLSSGHDREIDSDMRLGFSQKLQQAGETLDLSLHRTTSHENEHYDYTNEVFVLPAATFYNNLGFHEDRSTSEFGADYALPLSKTRILKAGYSFEQDDFDYGAAGNNVDPLTQAQIPDPNLTDDFKFRQQINAVYSSYQAASGPWTWLFGLRGELTSTRSQQLTENLTTEGRYLRLYPSLHIDRSISDRSTLSFGASRRVTRPDPFTLNPYVDYEYTPNLRSGNPGLKPQYTQSFEVGYAFEDRGVSHSLTAYYRRNRDGVTDVIENLDNGLTLATKANLPINDSAGAEFSSNGHIVPALAYSISGNLFYSQIDATALGANGLQSTTGLNGKLKLDYRPTAADSAQVTATRTDKRLTPQGYVSAINIVNLGYKRQLQPDLTLVMTVSDLFNGQRFHRYAVAPQFTEQYTRFIRGRIAYVGFVYTFGSARKEKQANFDYDQ